MECEKAGHLPQRLMGGLTLLFPGFVFAQVDQFLGRLGQGGFSFVIVSTSWSVHLLGLEEKERVYKR